MSASTEENVPVIGEVMIATVYKPNVDVFEMNDATTSYFLLEK